MRVAPLPKGGANKTFGRGSDKILSAGKLQCLTHEICIFGSCELQKRTLENINMGGGYAVVVRSLSDAQAAMKASEDKKAAFYIDPANGG